MNNYGFSTGGTGYDDEDRLVTWNRTDGNKDQSWSLSLVGDWSSFTEESTTQNRTHDDAHELTDIDSNSLAYDNKGNLTTNVNGDEYSWDFNNLMTGANTDGNAGDEVTFQYDALGRRVEKTVDSTTTVFVSITVPTQGYLAEQVVAEYVSGVAASDPERKYAYGAYIDEPLLYIDATSANEVEYYYHRNCQYSIAALSDSTATVVERYAYSAYGEPSFLDGSATPLSTQVSAKGNPYNYTGGRFESSITGYYLRARFYDATLGRFISRDPKGFLSGDANPYSFVHSKPLDHLDPTGLETYGECRRKIHYIVFRINFPWQKTKKGQRCCLPPGQKNSKRRKDWEKLRDKWAADAVRRRCAGLPGDPKKGRKNWKHNLPKCPATAAQAETSGWTESNVFLWYFHPGADRCFRKDVAGSPHSWIPNVKCAQQCCYSKKGKLQTSGPSCGTPDTVTSNDDLLGGRHQPNDVDPFKHLKDICKFSAKDTAEIYAALGWTPNQFTPDPTSSSYWPTDKNNKPLAY